MPDRAGPALASGPSQGPTTGEGGGDPDRGLVEASLWSACCQAWTWSWAGSIPCWCRTIRTQEGAWGPQVTRPAPGTPVRAGPRKGELGWGAVGHPEWMRTITQGQGQLSKCNKGLGW